MCWILRLVPFVVSVVQGGIGTFGVRQWHICTFGLRNHSQWFTDIDTQDVSSKGNQIPTPLGCEGEVLPPPPPAAGLCPATVSLPGSMAYVTDSNRPNRFGNLLQPPA